MLQLLFLSYKMFYCGILNTHVMDSVLSSPLIVKISSSRCSNIPSVLSISTWRHLFERPFSKFYEMYMSENKFSLLEELKR